MPLHTLLVDNGHRKPKWYQVLLQAVLPAVIVLLLGWGASKLVEMNSTLAVVVHTVQDTNLRVAEVNTKLEDHHAVTKAVLLKNSELHHHRSMKVPCTGCHIGKDGGG
jgi:hypothetical protein